MKDRILKLVLFIIFLICTVIAQEIPKWKVELNEPIKDYNLINEGKYLFFTNGEYAWCYDAESGNKIWESEEPKESKIFLSPDKKYFFSINEKLIAAYPL